MKKILFGLLVLSLSFCFVSCSSDDDGLSRTEYADKMAIYKQLEIDIKMYEEELAERREMIKKVWNDRYVDFERLISEEVRIIEDMKKELLVLKKELGLK